MAAEAGHQEGIRSRKSRKRRKKYRESLRNDGESRKATVYRTDIEGYEDARFVKVGKHLHYIDEDSSILEKATGEYHKEASWLVDVLKSEV